MQSIAETCVRFDAALLSINLVSEIAVPMFPTLNLCTCPWYINWYLMIINHLLHSETKFIYTHADMGRKRKHKHKKKKRERAEDIQSTLMG